MSHQAQLASYSFVEYTRLREMISESKAASRPARVMRRPSTAPARSSTARHSIGHSLTIPKDVVESISKPVIPFAPATEPVPTAASPPPVEPAQPAHRLRKAVSYRVRTQRQLVALLTSWDEDEQESPMEAIVKWIQSKQAKGKSRAEILAKLEAIEYGFHRLLHVHPLFHTARRQTGLPPSLTLPGEWGLSTTTNVAFPSTPSSSSTFLVKEKGKGHNRSPSGSLAERQTTRTRPRLSSEVRTPRPASPKDTIRPQPAKPDLPELADESGYMSDPSTSTSSPLTPPPPPAVPSRSSTRSKRPSGPYANPFGPLGKAALRQFRSVTAVTPPRTALHARLALLPPSQYPPGPRSTPRPSLSVNTSLPTPEPYVRPQTSLSMSYLESPGEVEFDEDAVGGLATAVDGGVGREKRIEELLEPMPLSPGAAQTFLRLFRMAS